MNQLFTHFALFSGFSMLLLFCKTDPPCHDLVGRWTDREGQILAFEPNGKATWMIKFGSMYDTFPIEYRYDCKQKRPMLDLLNFKSGPLAGKNLYGIVEWTSDSVFRFNADSGTSAEVRPESFHDEETRRYSRE